MSWDYSFTRKAARKFSKLDRPVQQRILKFLDERIVGCDDPRATGKGLSGELGEFWRYRVGDYRVLCEILDDEVLVLVVRVGHRGEIYD